MAACCVLAALSACAPKSDPAIDAVAQQTYDDLRLGRFDALQARLTPEAAKMVTPDQLRRIQAYLPPGAPAERRAVNWSMLLPGSGPQTAQAAYELDYASQGVLLTLNLQRAGGQAPWKVHGFNVMKADHAQLKSSVSLSPIGKPPGQGVFLAATILSPLLMITALVAVLRGPKMKRKWLWALAAFVGIGSLTMNWTTGGVGVQLASIQLIGAGVTRTGFMGFYPWVLKTTLPVGAVAALWRVWSLRRALRSEPVEAVG
jgi:hypothetical protein